MAQPQEKPDSVTDTLRRATAFHQCGQLAEAETLYRQTLTSQPRNFDALHLFGVLMHQRGHSAEALALIGEALKTNARSAAAYSNQAIVLTAMGRPADALESYACAIAVKPDYAEAHNSRGNLLVKLDRAADALASYEQALAAQPNYIDALINRATVLGLLGRDVEAGDAYARALAADPNRVELWIALGHLLDRTHRHGDALKCFDRALTLTPDAPEIHGDRGRILRSLKRFDEAVAAYDHALALKSGYVEAVVGRGNVFFEMRAFAEALTEYDRAVAMRPDFAQGHNNRGNALRELARPTEALACFDRAVELQDGYTEAFNNRGNALLELNRPADALADYDKALAGKPDFSFALVNRGNALRYLHRYDEAIDSFDRAVAIEPELAEAHWNKALLCLSIGDYERGLPGYEWRWRRAGEAAPRNFAQPQWTGEDLRGKTILLHAEQGFGDSIQMLRYLPLIRAQGASVVLELPDALMPLLGEIAVPLFARGAVLPPFDVHCPLMSLPLAFGTRVGTIPAAVPYLHVDEDRREKWQTRLPRGDALRVGLVWSGKPTHKNDHNRSVPLALLRPLLAAPGFEFVSLQREYRDSDLAELGLYPGLLRLESELADFADTAAAIQQCDLVIAVDTAVAHLAGALAKPLWVLLPAVLDWRWMLERDDSPWYPTARLFRQPQIGDWDSVMARLGEALASFAAKRQTPA